MCCVALCSAGIPERQESIVVRLIGAAGVLLQIRNISLYELPDARPVRGFQVRFQPGIFILGELRIHYRKVVSGNSFRAGHPLDLSASKPRQAAPRVLRRCLP